MSFRAASSRPVVLITNDDGPPSPSSPNIYSLAKLLLAKGWDVRVAVPDIQQSCMSMAYSVVKVVEGRYFYPLEPDGFEGEITTESRPLNAGESMEWILLSGTPATCANIALNNIWPSQVDLVISGPNHGRNSSSSFALCSGTVGAALAGAMSSYPSIALSYGVVSRPVKAEALRLATEVSVGIIERLWASWGEDMNIDTKRKQEGQASKNVGKAREMVGKVQLYSINVPLEVEYLEEQRRRIFWTRIARTGYGSFFKKTEDSTPKSAYNYTPPKPDASAAPGLNAGETARASEQAHLHGVSSGSQASESASPSRAKSSLMFRFAPDFSQLITPSEETLVEGTDAWALFHGYISVTPMQATFAEPGQEAFGFGQSQSQSTAELEPATEWTPISKM